MRKNLAKHTAKKLPLAKRVLALCFALIFVRQLSAARLCKRHGRGV